MFKVIKFSERLDQTLCYNIMFVAIVGTRFSGKSSIADYLVSSKGFTEVRLIRSEDVATRFEEKFEVCILGL
jgi:uridine kinase